VVEVNDPLSDAPETINEDAYEEGWMIAIQPSDPKELESLMDAKAYRSFVEEQE
jgi:glycine cleavage system H protein